MKWLVPEVLTEQSEEILLSDATLIAPDFMPMEVGNVLCRKVRLGELRAARVKDAMIELERVGVRSVVSTPILVDCVPIALKYQQSLFDIVYVKTAQVCNALLVTADERLVRAMEKTPFGSFVAFVGAPLRALDN